MKTALLFDSEEHSNCCPQFGLIWRTHLVKSRNDRNLHTVCNSKPGMRSLDIQAVFSHLINEPHATLYTLVAEPRSSDTWTGTKHFRRKRLYRYTEHTLRFIHVYTKSNRAYARYLWRTSFCWRTSCTRTINGPGFCKHGFEKGKNISAVRQMNVWSEQSD